MDQIAAMRTFIKVVECQSFTKAANQLGISVAMTSKLMQQLEEELDKVKGSLEMRKTLDRAKGILMDAYNLSESEAYRRIQQYSMAKRKTIKEVAEAIIRSALKNKD